MNLRKKFMAYIHLQMNLPPDPPPAPSVRTYGYIEPICFFFLLENLMKTEGFNDLRFIDFCVNQALLYYIYMAVFIVGLQTRSN